MKKPASTDHPVHPLIVERFSPRAFTDEPVTDEQLRSLFEAARWAASSLNEQPWRFIVARAADGKEFQRLSSCLNEKNQRWAPKAPLLLLVAANMRFTSSGNANRHAFHDVGLAVAQLTFQAAEMGLFVHQMAGFLPEKAREQYSIPEEFEPVTMIAVGRPGKPETLPEDLREREVAPRSRHPQSDFVFHGTWGKSF